MKNVRNFAILAHIDHGKSTLADRLLEFTHTVEKRKMKDQMLDQMDLERERGITIKLQPVRMLYQHSDRGQSRNDTQNDAENKLQNDAEGKLLNDAEDKLLYADLTYKVRGVIFEVRKKLGLGHKELVYHKAIEIELAKQSIVFKSEAVMPIFYEGQKVGIYQPDFIIEDKIILELKALPEIGRPQTEQIWSYLKGSEYKLALLANFGSKDLDIKRIVFDTARNLSQSSAQTLDHFLRPSASSPHNSAQTLDHFLRPSASSPHNSAQIQDYVLNLIDTPGHVDFGYEVSRSLAAVEGAVLLVDATKGVQAQTLSNLYLAIEQGLEIIPVVNKIDLPNAQLEKTKKEIVHILGCKEEDIILASGKTGEGVEKILEAIVEKVPSPRGDSSRPLRALIFDSKYDLFKGVVAYVRIVDGEVKRDDKIFMMASQKETIVVEVGHFKPQMEMRDNLTAGDIGYVATGLKDVSHCRVGDTITVEKNKDIVEMLPGYKEVKPMVYASFYPVEGDDYGFMRDALDKLKLNDAAFTFEPESNKALGRGFRCGFLGLLHLEIIKERMTREFNIDPTITTPSVVYEVKKTNSSEIEKVYAASEMPDPSVIAEISEPYVKLDIITPAEYLGSVMDLSGQIRSEYKNTEYLDQNTVLLSFEAPLIDVIINFHDQLKSVSSGFASMNYEVIGYRPYDLVKLDILIAGEKADAFSRIVPREKAHSEGKAIVEKLKTAIPKQNFAIALQASIGAKIIARETISAFRKDVISKLYGGDVTRKNKLLDKQKKGKKKMKNIGKVSIPSGAFLAVLKK